MSMAVGVVGRRTGGLVAGAALLLLCGGASQASADCTATAPDADGDVVTTCTATGAEQTFTVPSRIGALQVVAIGAFVFGNNVDRAADARGTIPVGVGGLLHPGDTLYVEVGTPGFPGGSGGTGGFNGGGNGGAAPVTGLRGSGGGGATDVRTCARTTLACRVTGVAATDPRLIVAAGVGGGGGVGFPATFGGAAGLPSPGADSRGSSGSGTPGRGATLAAGGGAGQVASFGAAGVAGQGGGGGPESGAIGVAGTGGGGGGGGGGFFGGGGGGGGGADLTSGPAAVVARATPPRR